MANGTIAFDTLQTSGQITGTAKSLDTDYVVSGSAKAWINFDQSNNNTRDSLNISSTIDDAVGNKHHNFTNTMGNANFSILGMCQGDSGDSRNRFINLANFADADIPTTSDYEIQTYAISGFTTFTDTDDDYTCTSINGDLA